MPGEGGPCHKGVISSIAALQASTARKIGCVFWREPFRLLERKPKVQPHILRVSILSHTVWSTITEPRKFALKENGLPDPPCSVAICQENDPAADQDRRVPDQRAHGKIIRPGVPGTFLARPCWS